MLPHLPTDPIKLERYAIETRNNWKLIISANFYTNNIEWLIAQVRRRNGTIKYKYKNNTPGYYLPQLITPPPQHQAVISTIKYRSHLLSSGTGHCFLFQHTSRNWVAHSLWTQWGAQDIWYSVCRKAHSPHIAVISNSGDTFNVVTQICWTNLLLDCVCTCSNSGMHKYL